MWLKLFVRYWSMTREIVGLEYLRISAVSLCRCSKLSLFLFDHVRTYLLVQIGMNPAGHKEATHTHIHKVSYAFFFLHAETSTEGTTQPVYPLHTSKCRNRTHERCKHILEFSFSLLKPHRNGWSQSLLSQFPHSHSHSE